MTQSALESFVVLYLSKFNQFFKILFIAKQNKNYTVPLTLISIHIYTLLHAHDKPSSFSKEEKIIWLN